MKYGPNTRAVHDGQGPDPATGAVVQPIHMATTFVQDGVGNLRAGFEYSRSGNPTRAALETALASLELATHGYAFASGMGAISTLILLFNPGDHIVYMEDCYGGTFRLFDQVMRRFGMEFTAIDASDLSQVEAAITPRTKLLWLETPTNPRLRILDIDAATKIAHAHGILVTVDNTFATPYLQNPLKYGVDFVVHSTTKYLGGHSDVVGGAVMLNDPELAEKLAYLQNALGAIPSPFDCWLLLRGIKTLPGRMQRHCANAMEVARFLSGHPHISQVYYPGLETHRLHNVAKRQMTSGFGGMVSFEVADEVKALDTLQRFRLISLAESLGAVESLAEHPARMTHQTLGREERERIGITDGLIRLSVGIEDVEDLIADLDQALD